MIRRHFNGGSLKARALKGGVVALSGFGAAQGIRLAFGTEAGDCGVIDIRA